MGKLRLAHILKALTLLLLCSSIYARELLGKSGYQSFILAGSLGEAGVSAQASSIPAQEALWSAEIVHRDAKFSPFHQKDVSRKDILLERLKRDAARVEAIYARLQFANKSLSNADLVPSQGTKQVSVEGFSSPVISGLNQGSGEYFTRLGVGTPPKDLYLVLDTGSDLSWIQCSPCGSCYQQSDPVFSPTLSSSFAPISCSAHLCSELEIRGCQNNKCLYQISYGDGSFTVGNFAQETLSFGGATVPGVGIGCGHDNEGLFVGAAGLLGLGRGTLSFPTQVTSKINSQFSYCLADRERGGPSSLLFGNGAVPAGASFTSLLKNPKLDTFYYVPLAAISVGGTQLPISRSDFSMDASGTGGVILDSGTSVTRLVASAYTLLRDAFRKGTRNLPSAGSFSLFDTCYNLQGMQSVDVPTVDLHFESGAVVKLPAANYLVSVDSAGTYCFAFASTSGDFSIIGNLQQQGFRISFDSASSQVGFAPNQC